MPQSFAETSRQEWADALEEAVKVGLLTPIGTSMYGIHPALPAHLAALWRREEPDGHDALRDATTRVLLSAYADFSNWLGQQVAGGDAALAFLLIDHQRRMLGHLLRYALEAEEWSQAQAIAQALGRYWQTRGLSEEARGWVDRVRVATEDIDGSPPPLDTPAGELWLFFVGVEAEHQVESGQRDAAETTYREVLAMLERQPASRLREHRLAVTYYHLGVVAKRRGHIDEAEKWYRRSLEIEKELVNQPGMASSYHELGMVAQLRGHFDDAEKWYRRSLEIREELGNRPGTAFTYHHLGMVALDRRHLDEADEWFRSSLGIRERLGDRPGMAWSYHELGIVAQLRGHLDEAEEWFRSSLGIDEELGDRPGMAVTYHHLGMVALDRRHLDEAEEWNRHSLEIREELDDRPGMASSYHHLGLVAQRRGHLDEAEKWYRRSLEIREELGNRPGMAMCYHQFGMVAQDRGHLNEAEEWYRRCLGIEAELGDRPGMASTYQQLALLAETRQRPEEALEWLVRCVVLFDEFAHRATGPCPTRLARFTVVLGMEELAAAWARVTGQQLPQEIIDFVTRQQEGQGSDG